jgi:hypothetical protein
VQECVHFARDHPLVTHSLFHLAFVSIAGSSTGVPREIPDCVKNALLRTVTNPQSPREWIVAIRQLLEFLDLVGLRIVQLDPMDNDLAPIDSDFPGLALCLRAALNHYDTSPDNAAMAAAYRRVGMFNEASLLAGENFESLGMRAGPNFVQGFSAILPAIAIAQAIVEREERIDNWPSRIEKA